MVASWQLSWVVVIIVVVVVVVAVVAVVAVVLSAHGVVDVVAEIVSREY